MLYFQQCSLNCVERNKRIISHNSERNINIIKRKQSRNRWYIVITSHTVVTDFEVGFELLEARSSRLELGVRDADLARASSGASPVEQRQHVRVAVDVSEVELDAPAEPHPAVDGRRHQQYATCPTGGVERLVKAVVATLCTPT